MINSISAQIPQYILFGCAAVSLVLALAIHLASAREQGIPSKGNRVTPAKKQSKAAGVGYRPVPVRSFVPMQTRDR